MPTWLCFLIGIAFLLVAVHRHGTAIAVLCALTAFGGGSLQLLDELTVTAEAASSEEVRLIPSSVGVCFINSHGGYGSSLIESDGYYYLKPGAHGASVSCIDARRILPWRRQP